MSLSLLSPSSFFILLVLKYNLLFIIYAKSVDILKELAVTNATKMIVSVDDKILELKIKEIQAGAEQCQAQGLDS